MRLWVFAILLFSMNGFSIDTSDPLIAKEPWLGLVSGYFSGKARFFQTPAENPQGKCVVLVHGWGVRGSSMRKMADALAKEGYDIFRYDYPSSKWPIAEQTALFLASYRKLVEQLPQNEKIFFLTHSMGGLLLRGAMAEMTEAECKRIEAIVMLGPPNHGSKLAYLGKIPGIRQINQSLGDMAPTEDNYALKLPRPQWIPPIAILAGKYDGKVSMESTHLPEEIPYEHQIVFCTHPGLRNPKNTLSFILEFYARDFKESHCSP